MDSVRVLCLCDISGRVSLHNRAHFGLHALQRVAASIQRRAGSHASERRGRREGDWADTGMAMRDAWAYALWICKRCSPSAAERRSNESVDDSKVTEDLDSTPTGAPLGGLRTPRLEELRVTTTARSASNAEARPRSVSRGRPANAATKQADAKKPGRRRSSFYRSSRLETAIKTVSKRTKEMAQAPTPVGSANKGSVSDASKTAVAAEEPARLPEPRTAL